MAPVLGGLLLCTVLCARAASDARWDPTGTSLLSQRARAMRGHVAAKDDCASGLCGGIASYPVAARRPGDTRFYAEFDVPALPKAVDGITDFIYFNIFFSGYKDGKMNQFVPQLMLGNPLCNSTGPPEYKPIWHEHDTWVFGSQYFFEVHNRTSNKTEGHAATGELFPAQFGEVIWTSFELDTKWTWNLSMGILGDPARTSTVISEKPFMGLVEYDTKSWAEPQYNHTNVNSCWELYNVRDRAHYPSSGSTYDMRVTTDVPGGVKWSTRWSEIEKPTCEGAPTSEIYEVHNETQQDIFWRIYW